MVSALALGIIDPTDLIAARMRIVDMPAPTAASVKAFRAVFAALSLLFGVALWAVGARELARNRRWLARVQTGGVERWEIVNPSPDHGSLTHLPGLVRTADLDGVLIEQRSFGPYRREARARARAPLESQAPRRLPFRWPTAALRDWGVLSGAYWAFPLALLGSCGACSLGSENEIPSEVEIMRGLGAGLLLGPAAFVFVRWTWRRYPSLRPYILGAALFGGWPILLAAFS